MKLYKKKEDCCGCGACMNACPVGAIRMVQDGEGFWYPRKKKKVCTQCGECEQVCPLRNQVKGSQSNRYLGVQAKDEKVRYTSSSGGVFSMLAQYVFQREGVVYGAAYNENMEVVHREVFNYKQLEALKKTKYVQSSSGTVYKEIEVWLKKQKWVLFCGTPCQSHALKCYLKEEYDRLLIVDLVCYGTPSPGIWSSYVKYLEERHGGRMSDFRFRDKRNKDNGHACSYVINNSEFTGSLYKDIYCKAYFTNYNLRPSCYHCEYSTVERCSDFTIGDFWGIENINADMDDGMGTSMVILHNQKAQKIWNCIKEEFFWFECRKEDILQPRLVEPTNKASGRRLFMLLYRVLPFTVFWKLVGRMIG